MTEPTTTKHVHFITRTPGNNANSSKPQTAAEIRYILDQAEFANPHLVAIAAGEGHFAVSGKAEAWVAVSWCSGDCEHEMAQAVRVAEHMMNNPAAQERP
ncbi:hypothetical protein ACIBQ1_38370 [Nonomuraea sp. NPDC050153]|uniref:hypothetical protein n=1 Tax=Nonomuraea sp. NPDC050153 TaxID=3364359 RepID=UPI00378CF28D